MHKILLPVILIALFVAGFVFVQDRLKKINIPASIREIVVSKSECDDECKKIIREEVDKAIATLSATAKTQTITYKTTANPQTQFIPLDGSYSTISTSWVDVPGTDVSFDIAKDYDAGAKVSWETSLKVAHGNGQAYARLYDSTHGIAVSGSEITTTDNVDYKSVSSGNLNLWSGRNTYKVQVKSLNSFEVFYTGGKIRVAY
ncbi:MAG: hypothetical protein UX13_C0014G0014 [Candidatus Woesebacteria bacterium GW2011_GWB1_45_5]|uniref:Uncharacterized protein n=1 Tax=Candidatus Woesebacteria bacterium GW2011_GWB1_45_5 TaxID=1618581 RepID=A0A0G1MPS1_9BACT|nr:MAG: hypothetical protein UX13_C0014G0014 [Candidatus Woesebacteria bacterium GW2011_GWB1_45_5]